ncbi:MAG: hypothetical protein ACP5H3_03805 [Candidatus Aenigmatarchaeota archaeon]
MKKPGLIGLLLQVIGTLWLLYNQYQLYSKAKKEFGSLKKLFLDVAFPRVAMDENELKKLSNKETDNCLNGYPLAKFLYEDFRDSIFALIVALIGEIIELISVFV